MSLLRRSRPPYKLLSVLLRYPDERLLDALPAIGDAVAGLPSSSRRPLQDFHGYLAGTEPVALRQAYVETFDLQRRASLYLMALLRLERLYAASGLMPATCELSDYLPLMLEFAAHAPSGMGERVLAEHRAGLELVHLALREAGSAYTSPVGVVCAALPRPAPEELEAAPAGGGGAAHGAGRASAVRSAGDGAGPGVVPVRSAVTYLWILVPYVAISVFVAGHA